VQTKNEARRAFLFGLREDGSPTCHPMVAIEREGQAVFNTYRKSAKARNFQHDPRAAVVLLPDWQAAPCEAQVLTGVLEETDPIGAGQADDGGTGEGVAGVPQTVSARAQRRVDDGKRMYVRLRTGA
jgi:hypothetical protein